MKVLRLAKLSAQVGLTLTGIALAALAAASLVPAGRSREPGRALASLGSWPAPSRAVVVAQPVWEAARISRVVDGDTYEVLTDGQVLRVRLLGVDAPEHDQAFGLQATDSVTALLRGRLVQLQRHGLDLYGRTLGTVRVLPLPSFGPLTSVALDSVLVVRGWAWAFDPQRKVAARAPEQAAAQRAGRGLWKCGVTEALPPKLWRGFTMKTKRRYGVGCTW